MTFHSNGIKHPYDHDDLQSFITQSCEELVGHLGVYNVWIALIEDDQVTTAVSSFEKSFSPFKEYTTAGNIPYCVKQALLADAIALIEDPHVSCGDCPLANRYRGRIGLASRIQHNDKTYGVLCASAPAHIRDDELLGEQFSRASRHIGQIIDSLRERVMLQKELQESRRQMASILDSLPGMAYRCRVDEAWTMEFVSSGSIELTGYSPHELIGNAAITYVSIIHHDDRSSVAELITKSVAAGMPYTLEYRILHANGDERWVWEKGHAVKLDDGSVRLEGFITDVTERRGIEARLLRMQKNESLAVMAGGMAHDFNNMLMSIMGNAEDALNAMDEASPGREHLHYIVDASQRAGEICRQMLAFSGQGGVAVESINLNEQVDRVIPFINTFLPANVALKTVLGVDLPSFDGDPSDVRYIILQVVKNAIEACGEKGGTVILKTGSDYYDGRPLKGQLTPDEPPAGWFLYFSVKDDGCGIDPKVMPKLFDPFFTTKFTGRGMGLPAVQGIVRSLGGKILVSSRLESGSLFKILFPVAVGRGVPVKINRPEPAFRAAKPGTILVVDDEPNIRLLTMRMLERAGYQTITAENGLQAVELFKQFADTIDIVIMDLTMPKMDGIQAVEQILSIHPDARIILSTGYSEVDVSTRLDMSKLTGILLKPYTQKELLSALTVRADPA